MVELSQESVRRHFDNEARLGRRLLPDPTSVKGLGTMVKYERAAALMAAPDVHRVLDVGCNRGSIEALFHQQHPEKASRTVIDGVDISAEAIGQAQALELPACTFRTYDGVELPFDDDSVDLVIMVEVIEHVVRKEELLKDVYRVLRPGGTLFFSTPNPDCWTLRIEAFAWRVMRAALGRKQPAKDAFVSGPALTSLLREAGLESTSPAPLYFWPHLYVAFVGWSVFPPLAPRWLFRYQKWCALRAERIVLSDFLDRRVKWTLMGLYQKPVSSDCESGR